jgi:hypothetical protein
VLYSLPKNQINLGHGLDEEICRIMNDGITDPWPEFSEKVFGFISHSTRYSKFLKMSLSCGNGIKSHLTNLVKSSGQWNWQFETHYDQSGDCFYQTAGFYSRYDSYRESHRLSHKFPRKLLCISR